MNYRDLQNISNLSQQILVEGANEDHNVLNRWPYTSPYLQESTELDEGYKSFPHDKVEAKTKRLEMDNRTNEPLTGKSDSEVNSILARKKKSGERATSLRLASRTAYSYLPQKKSRKK